MKKKEELDLVEQIKLLQKDANRYRWLKSRKNLTLRTEKPTTWIREDGTEFNASYSLAESGTQHAPTESLDLMIDLAMLTASVRDEQ